ncbi:sigma factor binding protein 2, chloroplastic-like [Typha angustifolia]|uniref:sigma factor binding protein 2, chloroplastic-like n=1 Tax=Typha angustifolia TaxID=59011 RepID=UPI003C2BAE4C
MEKLSVHQKGSKQAKAKKKPIKVVYISNPMKVKATAEEFRTLVQELTGRDSNVADLSKFPGPDDGGESRLSAPAPHTDTTATLNPGSSSDHGGVDPCETGYKTAVNPFDMLDDAFAPQMLDNLPGFSPSAGFFDRYGYGGLRNLDKV